MVDVATSYDQMSEAERARFEQEHFDRLPALDKFRVANREFASGMTPVGEKAAIIDNAYGNGDGQWTNEDAKILEEKRNDMGLLNGIADAGKSMFTVAAIQNGQEWLAGGQGFQLGIGGVLGNMFNSQSLGMPAGQAPAPEAGLNPGNQGVFQRLSKTLGL